MRLSGFYIGSSFEEWIRQACFGLVYFPFFGDRNTAIFHFLRWISRNRSEKPLLSVLLLLFGLLLAELIVAAFFLFNQNFSQDVLRFDKTGDFRSIYHFVHMNWKIIRWVVVVALILEVIALVIALYLRSMNIAVYDSSDDEIIVYPGSQRARRTDERRGAPATGSRSTVGNDRENLVVV